MENIMKFVALILIMFSFAGVGYANTETVSLKIRTSAYDDKIVYSTLEELTSKIKLENTECGNDAISCGNFDYVYEKDGYYYFFVINITKFKDRYKVFVGLPLGFSTVYLKNINDLELMTEAAVQPMFSGTKSGRAVVYVKTL